MAKIAFIGLGNMGGPMALNLIKAGHELSVFDINQAALQTAEKAGANLAKDIPACVNSAEFVISMLPSSPHVDELYLQGDNAIILHAPLSALLIDCSTIAPATSRKVSAAASEAGFDMVDAPVSGGVGGAIAATLTFIVGGSQTNFEKAKTILESMGKNIFHAGESGNGQVAKICNNMLLAIHMIGTCEALNLGTKCGIDAKVLTDIMKVSSGRNWSLDTYNPYPGVMENVPASNEYQGGFGVDLMLKDLGLAMEAAEESESNTPLGGVAKELYQMQSDNGFGKLDFSSILKIL